MRCMVEVVMMCVVLQVTQVLVKGGTVGIFPEGGSHDRTSMLPFKPGIAVMALK